VSSEKRRAGGGAFFAILAVLTALMALTVGAGCAKNTSTQEVCRPGDLGRCIIEDVDVVDDDQVDEADIQAKIATTQTSHLLFGAFRQVPVLSILDAASVEYERFDRFVLERDLARIERYYRARGFYEAHARAGRVTRRSDGRVRVEISVDEGKPVTIGRVDLEWKDWDLERAKNITKYVTEAKNELRIGDRFEEEAYERTKSVIRRAMSDRGFAYAKVEGRSYVDLFKHEAQVIYTIELGPHCSFGDIKLTGLGELPEGPIRNAIGIDKGEEFSTSALTSAEIALADFGVFSAVDVRPELSPEGSAPNPVVPVTFELQVAPLRAVKAGVGAEIGSIVEGHVVGGWENRNFLGGLRRLTVEAKPGLVFYPWSVDKIIKGESPKTVLPQLRLRFDLRQPIPFDTRTSARFGGEFNLYTPPTGDDTPELPYILGYQTYSGIFGFDRPFWDARVHLGLFYNIELNYPFSYNENELPGGFGRVLIPSLQAIASLDLRFDANDRPNALEPNKGVYVKADVQYAGGFLMGDAHDIRITPEFRGYIPISKKVTLAFRLATGFILDHEYDRKCEPNLNAESCAEAKEARMVQILQLRGYFSGGANSNRGYPYRGVGPHAQVESLYLVNGVAPDGPGESIAIGGLTLWETSAELRFPIALPLGGVFFLDSSDVSSHTSRYRFKRPFQRPHLSAGFGLRYATPVGPARLDIGYRIPCAQVIGECNEAKLPPEEGVAAKLGKTLPIAVSLAIGEAF
jgi:outer membrane protein insertion porin family/translocation and assembly module TamA